MKADLMPAPIVHSEIRTCPCCGAPSTEDSEIALGFDRFICQTEVILPERAVIHLGRICKSNMRK